MVWRPHDTGFEPLEEAVDVDLEQQMRDIRQHALQDAVIDSIFSEKNKKTRLAKIEKLQAIGLIDAAGDDDQLKESIVKRFRDFFERKNKGLPKRWKRQLFFEAAKLLVSTGVLRLNTCRDWQVDRKNPAENVGLKNFEGLENLLWEKYGPDSGRERFFHLHSGSGDNNGVYEANERRRKHADSTWRNVGFGNKLYAPIETLIGQFLKPQFRDDSMHPDDPEVKIVIRILTEAIQKKLHERWYPDTKDVKESEMWVGGKDRQDFNEVFELLRNPRELLAGINFPHAVSIHVAKYQLSGRFTGDKPTYVSDTVLAGKNHMSDELEMQPKQAVSDRDAVMRAYKTLMELSGMPDTLINAEYHEFLEKDAEALLGRISSVLRRATKLHLTDLHERRVGREVRIAEHEVQMAELEKEVEKLLPAELAHDILSAPRLEPMIELLKRTQDGCHKRLKWMQGKITEKPESAADLEMTLPEALAKRTRYDELLREERTILWVLQQIRSAQGQLPNKVRTFCKAILKIDVHPPLPIGTRLTERLTERLSHVQHELIVHPGPDNEHVHETLERLFEPEFIAGIERAPDESLPPNECHLFDAGAMDEDKRKTIHNVPEASFVRANDLLIGPEEVTIPGTDFTIRREGTSVVIDGSKVGDGESDIQTNFALEITSQLDLNERPYAYLRNFVPGTFADIGSSFPPHTFSLISAVRSDSHIDDEAFAKVCADYTHLLAPGGCAITDGIEESYSQVLRLIKSLPEDQARIEVVMNAKTHRPKALLIQRAHPNGYLSADEKKSVFQDDVYFKRPEDIAELRPDLEIRHDICNEIRAIRGHKAFAWIGDQIELDREGSPSRLEELITGAVVGRMLNDDPSLGTKSLRQSIARHIIARHNLQAGHPQPSLLGKEAQNLDEAAMAKLVPDIKSLPHRTVWTIRQALMRVLKPENETSDVVQAVERCIIHAFADERSSAASSEHRKKRRRKNPAEVQPAERRAELEKLFDLGRNIDYSPSPLLTQAAIGYIQRRTADRAERAIDKGLHLTDPDRYPLRQTPGVIRRFRRRGTEEELPDVRTTLLKDNAAFAAPEAGEYLRQKIRSLRKVALELHEKTGHEPIGFIDFRDCVTNDLLKDRLREIFGEQFESAVSIAPCEFVTNGDRPTILHKKALLTQLDGWRESSDRLVIGGGSWENAFEAHGTILKDILAKHLLTTGFRDCNIRAFGICFFNQILGDMAGKSEKETLAHTVPGPLEVGLAAITPTGAGRTHPLFRDCGEAFTAVMSRGGHLQGDDLHEKGVTLRTIARSGSGGTAAWETTDGVLGGIQWHPEVRCVDQASPISPDAMRVLVELMGQRDHLRYVFECEPEELIPNFDARRADIKADAGTDILVNALLHHLTELRKNL